MRASSPLPEVMWCRKSGVINWRWAGVPFFLRTGKRLPERRTQIAIQFKGVPHSIFGGPADGDLIANRLVIDLQPDEDIELLLMNSTIRHLVQEKASSEEIKAQAIRDKMITLREDGVARAFEGTTTLSEVIRVTIE